MPDRPLLLGHRGARATRSILENTIASFDMALEHGCDGFEFDVRSTKDSAAILCHDAKLGTIEIAAATRSELPQLASLEEVLERYRDRAFLDLELKVAGLENKILSALERYAPQCGFVISSFFSEILLKLHSHDSTIALGFILDRRELLSRWKELPVDWVIPNYKLASKKMIEEVHGKGKKTCIWTVNEADAMQRFTDWGADAIISDDTQLLAATLKH